MRTPVLPAHYELTVQFVAQRDSGRKFVTMMQTTESWYRNDFADRIFLFGGFATCWSLLLQAKMRSVIVVVANIIGHQSLEMMFIEDNYTVEQVAATRAHEAFGNAILPRTLDRGTDGFHPEGVCGFDDFGAKGYIPVEDQVARCGVVRECFTQLLRHPLTCRMLRDVEVQNAPTIMSNHEEAIKHAKGQRGHREEIHRRNGLTVVAEESRPSFRRFGVPRRFVHPVQYGSLRYPKTKHLELAMNARCAPSRVLDNHLEDQFTQLLGRRPPAAPSTLSGYPFPVEPESCTVPADDRIWLNDEQNATPIVPDSPHDQPKRLVDDSDSRPPILPSQDNKLLTQGEIFKNEVASRT